VLPPLPFLRFSQPDTANAHCILYSPVYTSCDDAKHSGRTVRVAAYGSNDISLRQGRKADIEKSVRRQLRFATAKQAFVPLPAPHPPHPKNTLTGYCARHEQGYGRDWVVMQYRGRRGIGLSNSGGRVIPG
jgi:hypothetical protein